MDICVEVDEPPPDRYRLKLSASPSPSKYHDGFEFLCEQKQSSAGFGTFALEEIPEGAVVIIACVNHQERGLHVPVETVSSWPEAEQELFYGYAFEIEEGVWCGPPRNVATLTREQLADVLPSLFLNHSCNPNLWFDNQGCGHFVAMRDIEIGEELTYDYAMSDHDDSHTCFNCSCGSGLCRKVVSGYDYRRPELQLRYASHFSPCVARKMVQMPPLSFDNYWAIQNRMALGKDMQIPVELRHSDTHGWGLFALEPIDTERVAWRNCSELESEHNHFTLSEIAQWSIAKQQIFFRWAFQVDTNEFCGLEESYDYKEDLMILFHPSVFMNHCCDPNLWFDADGNLVTRRQIAANEEITFDYGTSYSMDSIIMSGIKHKLVPNPCACENAKCRGNVTGNDWKLPSMVNKYAGHFHPHIQRRMDNERRSNTEAAS